ncbi:hypothetical protein H0B56_14545 [Haloechinothrix sp. YIM 98757]|uniref:Metal binding domain of Ada n=1 Tax=Haloechinothrix aidingensis TaxID=2752311 RepID=A0A838ABZ4_9PSEU|nr:hypothetical protein [Haloechinothrix aidingensis]MBA0126766.1 hypothetical protein [Haloechinothrix aidingensis]
MIAFVLIGVAAVLLLVSQISGVTQLAAAAMVFSLISIVMVTWRAWADRRTRQRKIAATYACGDGATAPAGSDVVERDGIVSETERITSEDIGESGADVRPADGIAVALGQEERADSGEAVHDVEVSAGTDDSAVPDHDTEWVHVIAGRKRFHQPDCSLLVDRRSDELTREEAVEEGFTPCSLCMPLINSSVRRIG